MRWLSLALVSLVAATTARAEVKTRGWRHESELSIARASGNTETETYSAKQSTAYRFSESLVRLSGHYLYGTARGLENARNWDIAFRYEHDLDRSTIGYLAHRYESDRFVGFELRVFSGGGVKYYFRDRDRDKDYFFGEIGYTYAKENRVAGTVAPLLESHFVRTYFEYRRPLWESTSFKAGLESLYDLANSDNFQMNIDVSLTVSMSKVLSLKAGYVGRYRVTAVVAGNRNYDDLLSTSLIAKFVPDPPPKAPSAVPPPAPLAPDDGAVPAKPPEGEPADSSVKEEAKLGA
jgi:putative salt-induced outer membrane protein YdiY